MIAVPKDHFTADYGLAKRTGTEFVGKVHKSGVLKSTNRRALGLSRIFVERSLSGWLAILSRPTVGSCTRQANRNVEACAGHISDDQRSHSVRVEVGDRRT